MSAKVSTIDSIVSQDAWRIGALARRTSRDSRSYTFSRESWPPLYNGFSKWVFFGGEGIISENDPEEQEKRIKYKDLVSNIIVFQNVVDMTFALRQLIQEGYSVTREDIAALSPYLTRHIKRFGDYVIDLETVPRPLEAELPVSV